MQQALPERQCGKACCVGMVARKTAGTSPTRRVLVFPRALRPHLPTRRRGRARRSATASWAARLLTGVGCLLTVLTGNLEVSGALPESIRGRPFLLAANHIGVFDTAVLITACRRFGLVPRFVTNGGLFDTPLVGALLRSAGHLRVDPQTAGCAVRGTALLPELDSSRPVLIYPEGRISRDPGLWPDRGQTGLARLALTTGHPVLILSQWGAHRVIPRSTPPVRSLTGLVRLTLAWLRAVRTRHRVRFQVHLAGPVDLSDLRPGHPGEATRAHARIMLALTAGLVPLRAGEPDRPEDLPHGAAADGPQGRPSPWRPR